MRRLIYVSHPEVRVDPAVPVPQWSLSDTGRARATAMLEQPWVSAVASVASSPETKALEAAKVLGDQLELRVQVIDASHEIDRSATGFVTHDRHEALADRLFAEPSASADGWERAIDAQRRILGCVRPFIDGSGQDDGNQVMVGHGGVGTLLLCHLLGVEIDRSLDQPGQGHYWAYDVGLQRVLHRWRPVDHIEPTIRTESPDQPDVIALLEAHLDFARQTSPPDHVHALDLAGLMAPDITFCAARRNGELVGVGALRSLGEGRAEIKSMHTAASGRGHGVGRLVLDHLLGLAHDQGCRWVGLETGTMSEFAPARALYESLGFERCEPFGDYTDNEYSLCMSLDLTL